MAWPSKTTRRFQADPASLRGGGVIGRVGRPVRQGLASRDTAHAEYPPRPALIPPLPAPPRVCWPWARWPSKNCKACARRSTRCWTWTTTSMSSAATASVGSSLSSVMWLLDHLRQQGFERVVFVAHSQGTVIAAELLRFVQHWHLLGAASAQKVDPSQTPDPSLAPDASPCAARCASSTPCAFRRSTPAWGTTPTRMTSMSTRPMCGLSCWLW